MGKTLEVTGKHGLGKPRGSSADLGAEDKISESDIEVYLICLSAFMTLLETEKKVAIKILPSSPLSSLMQTFEVIIRDAVEHMTADGQVFTFSNITFFSENFDILHCVVIFCGYRDF